MAQRPVATGTGARAAELTRQLVAFSRNQVLQPQSFDLNRVVRGISPMLTGLLGEDIELRLDLSPDGAPIHADLRQLEQVLMNLALNSRDAMPNGGSLRANRM